MAQSYLTHGVADATQPETTMNPLKNELCINILTYFFATNNIGTEYF